MIKRILFWVLLVTVLVRAQGYFTPGLQLFYDLKGNFSFGAKVSIGTLVLPNVANNMTFGFQSGNYTRFYMEIQASRILGMPDLFPFALGGGGGASFFRLSRDSKIKVIPQLSLFGGSFLFLNATYCFGDDPRFRGPLFGSTLQAIVPTDDNYFDF